MYCNKIYMRLSQHDQNTLFTPQLQKIKPDVVGQKIVKYETSNRKTRDKDRG